MNKAPRLTDKEIEQYSGLPNYSLNNDTIIKKFEAYRRDEASTCLGTHLVWAMVVNRYVEIHTQAQLDADHKYYQEEIEKLEKRIKVLEVLAKQSDERYTDIWNRLAQTRQDTIREIKEWGNHPCDNENHKLNGYYHHECFECWQSLGEEK